MSYASRRARRFADAVFQLALERSAAEAVAADVGRLAELLAELPDLAAVLDHRRIPIERKLELAQRAAGEIAGAEAEPSAAELTGHFLRLLVERRRVALLPEIAAALRDMLDLHQGVIRARVTTAVPLLAAEREMIEAKLRSLVGAQRVELDEQVTRSIQGGVIIHVAGKVIDASVRSYLESLRENLRRVRVSEFSGDRMLALDYARLRDEARAADAG